MDGAHTIIGVVVIALLLVGTGIAATYASHTTAPDFDANETVESGAVGTLVTLDNSSIDGAYYSETATVINQADGTELDNSTDYTWNQGNGTLTVESEAAANTTLSVDYTYETRTETQVATTGIIANILQSGAWIPLLLVVALAVLGMSALGGLT